MFDLGWTELLVIGVVALIVVGPKDLPVLFRSVGRFVGKAKGMAREFSQAMNDAADESGVRDVTKGLKAAANPVGTAMDGVKEAAQEMAKSIDPTNSGTSKTYKPGSETEKLSQERAQAAKKIQAATARAAADRKAREAAEALEFAEAAEAEVDAVVAETPAPAADGSETKT